MAFHSNMAKKDRNINSFAVHDGKVIGCTSYPKNQILVFDLPEE